MRWPGHGISWKRFLTAFKKEWEQDKITDLAAALTFFGLLALFPFLIFLVALMGLVLKLDQIDALIQQVASVAPSDVSRIIGNEFRSIHQGSSGGLLTVGILGALWSASGGITSLMTALNGVYAVKEQRPFWKVRGIALLATIATSVVVLVAALLGVAAGPVAQAIGGPIGTAILWLRLPLAGVLMMLVWAFLYYLLPDVEQTFKFITPGSVMGVVIWVIASWGFSQYVTHFGSYNKTYGAIGSVVVLLMWMWLSSIVLLAGAEINATIEHISPEGKRTGAKSMVDTGADAPKGEKSEQDPGLATPHPAPQRPSGKKLALGAALTLLLTRKHRHA